MTFSPFPIFAFILFTRLVAVFLALNRLRAVPFRPIARSSTSSISHVVLSILSRSTSHLACCHLSLLVSKLSWPYLQSALKHWPSSHAVVQLRTIWKAESCSNPVKGQTPFWYSLHKWPCPGHLPGLRQKNPRRVWRQQVVIALTYCSSQ